MAATGPLLLSMIFLEEPFRLTPEYDCHMWPISVMSWHQLDPGTEFVQVGVSSSSLLDIFVPWKINLLTNRHDTMHLRQPQSVNSDTVFGYQNQQDGDWSVHLLHLIMRENVLVSWVGSVEGVQGVHVAHVPASHDLISLMPTANYLHSAERSAGISKAAKCFPATLKRKIYQYFLQAICRT